MTFATALSEHPVAADAVGEVLGTIVERGGVEPDLAVLFLSDDHAEFAGEISAAVRQVLRPTHLVGSSASAVIGGRRETEDRPALALWASWSGPVTPVRLSAAPTDDGVAISGVPTELPEGATLLLLVDPFSFPADGLVDHLGATRPDVAVVGGLASAATEPRGNVLLVDDETHRDGAVGVVVPREQLVGPVVSQGCRPLGEPWVVTASERNFIQELGGRPAMERLSELVAEATPEEKALLASGVHLGVVIDENRSTFDRSDFLVRAVIGGDQAKGVLAVGEQVEVGTTVQFLVRDAGSAHDDLDELLRGVEGDAALVFTCNGRGSELFGVDDHDANLVADHVGTDTIAGMFCAGEIGPVGGRSFLHGFTASVLVFAEPDEHPSSGA